MSRIVAASKQRSRERHLPSTCSRPKLTVSFQEHRRAAQGGGQGGGFPSDGEVEQRQFTGPMFKLQANPDGPDLLQLQRGLPAEQLAFVPTCVAAQENVSERQRFVGDVVPRNSSH
jgi:hypothetical protein